MATQLLGFQPAGKMGYRLNGGCPGKRGQAVTELVEIRCGYVILEWRVIKR